MRSDIEKCIYQLRRVAEVLDHWSQIRGGPTATSLCIEAQHLNWWLANHHPKPVGEVTPPASLDDGLDVEGHSPSSQGD